MNLARSQDNHPAAVLKPASGLPADGRHDPRRSRPGAGSEIISGRNLQSLQLHDCEFEFFLLDSQLANCVLKIHGPVQSILGQRHACQPVQSPVPARLTYNPQPKHEAAREPRKLNGGFSFRVSSTVFRCLAAVLLKERACPTKAPGDKRSTVCTVL